MTFEKIKELAEAGDEKAQMLLGNMYDFGDSGLKIDKVESMKWYSKAADQGNKNAQGYMQIACWYGEGVKKDRKKALEWQSLARANNNKNKL